MTEGKKHYIPRRNILYGAYIFFSWMFCLVLIFIMITNLGNSWPDYNKLHTARTGKKCSLLHESRWMYSLLEKNSLAHFMLKTKMGNTWPEVEWYYMADPVSLPPPFILYSRSGFDILFILRKEEKCTIWYTHSVCRKRIFAAFLWRKKKDKESSWCEVG